MSVCLYRLMFVFSFFFFFALFLCACVPVNVFWCEWNYAYRCVFLFPHPVHRGAAAPCCCFHHLPQPPGLKPVKICMHFILM